MPVGVLLAAGAGRRMGRPKALVRDRDGRPWLVRALRALRDGGCDPVIVVLGCESAAAAALVHDEFGSSSRVGVVVAEDWADGMGASLRAGLRAVEHAKAPAAAVSLVDLPDVGPQVVHRVIERGMTGTAALARAVYGGRPGHPVLLGRVHWRGVAGAADGDRGARDYLARHVVHRIECGDLAGGHDVDRLEPLS